MAEQHADEAWEERPCATARRARRRRPRLGSRRAGGSPPAPAANTRINIRSPQGESFTASTMAPSRAANGVGQPEGRRRRWRPAPSLTFLAQVGGRPGPSPTQAARNEERNRMQSRRRGSLSSVPMPGGGQTRQRAPGPWQPAVPRSETVGTERAPSRTRRSPGSSPQEGGNGQQRRQGADAEEKQPRFIAGPSVVEDDGRDRVDDVDEKRRPRGAEQDDGGRNRKSARPQDDEAHAMRARRR